MTKREISIQAFSNNDTLSQEEKDFFIRGTHIMFDLGWPVGPVDKTTCERAIAGLLPKYENGLTLLNERAAQAKEAQDKRRNNKP